MQLFNSTVDEPWAVFIIMGNDKGTKIPIFVPARSFPIASPVPVAFITIPNIPPAAVTISIGPAFSTGFPENRIHRIN